MSDGFSQAISRAMNGLKMALGRGRVQLTKDDGPVQMVQVQMSAKELMDMARLSEFGLASRIPQNGDVAAIFLNAERTWGIVIASGHQKYRFKLQNDGEVALYDAFGKSVLLGKDGIVVDAGGKPVTLNDTGDVTLNMGGKNVIVNNPGAVNLTGAGGRKVVCDGDLVTGGVVHAAAGQKVTAT